MGYNCHRNIQPTTYYNLLHQWVKSASIGNLKFKWPHGIYVTNASLEVFNTRIRFSIVYIRLSFRDLASLASLASSIWRLARHIFGLILTWRIHSVVENVGIFKVGAHKYIAVKPMMSLKSDRFSVYRLSSALLTLWVTHLRGKLNVTHIIYLESKKICWQRQSIHSKTYFYLNQYSLQFM